MLPSADLHQTDKIIEFSVNSWATEKQRIASLMKYCVPFPTPLAFYFLRITILENNAKYTRFNPAVTKIKLRVK